MVSNTGASRILFYRSSKPGRRGRACYVQAAGISTGRPNVRLSWTIRRSKPRFTRRLGTASRMLRASPSASSTGSRNARPASHRHPRNSLTSPRVIGDQQGFSTVYFATKWYTVLVAFIFPKGLGPAHKRRSAMGASAHPVRTGAFSSGAILNAPRPSGRACRRSVRNRPLGRPLLNRKRFDSRAHSVSSLPPEQRRSGHRRGHTCTSR
jgi:hypothetical protein